MLFLICFLFFVLFLFNLLFLNKLLLEVILIDVFRCDFKFYFYVDWMSCLFLIIVLFISSIVIFYRKRYIEEDVRNQKFLYLVLLFVFSILLIILRTNMVMILLGWDGLGLVSYCLVIFYQNESSAGAGMITVLTNRIGDVGIILSIVFLLNFGRFSFNDFILSSNIILYVVFFMLLSPKLMLPTAP